MSSETLALIQASDTEALGAIIARALQAGEAVCLWGPLGAGKTTLARGLIRALMGPQEETPSPTFTLVQTYEGPDFPVSHLDLYRLSDPEDARELGLDEALEEGVAVIEWPERLGARLPPDRLDIRLRIEGDGRSAEIERHGRWKGRKLEF
ncbi:MAG TPA: tRNA (adenosine(37)-N6)-threonylcarbamoyltransferase complex ATPase subunit type 1 TsaE [Caulobacteraceae bacterium]|nr:tRNA (adenosine(37)-N6)-threonylcarbamoyltransferase complex ATPase subunit type 1 TsaE [Caulobacteraceae bacterium]